MTTQQTQIARPTSAVPAAEQQNATQGSAPQQSKPAFVAPKPQAQIQPQQQAQIQNPNKIAAAPAPAKKAAAPAPVKKAAPVAKKPAAKKAAPAAKKAAPAAKKAAWKPAAKPAAQKAAPAAKAQQPSNSNVKQQASSSSSWAGNAGAFSPAQLASQATEGFNQAISASKDNLQAVIECGNNAASLSKSIGAELNKIATQAIAQNTQAVQKFLACRTASDLVNLSNNLLRSHADQAYNGGLKLAEIAAQCTRIAEPINTRLAHATHSLTKKFSK